METGHRRALITGRSILAPISTVITTLVLTRGAGRRTRLVVATTPSLVAATAGAALGAAGSPTVCVSAQVKKSFSNLPSRSPMDTRSTLVGKPAVEAGRHPTRRSSQASPSDPSVADVSYRRGSGTGSVGLMTLVN